LPRGFNTETGEENPTAGVLQKVVEMLKGLMPEPATDKSQNEMKITVFAALAALLAVKDGFEADEKGNVSLTQDQLKAVDDELKKQNDACKQASDTLKAQKTKIDKLEQEKRDLEEQVKNLKSSAGTKEEENVDDAGNVLNAANELFNTIKDAL
jgi:septal ring factor EnvC (AmiA/AmiB activator)